MLNYTSVVKESTAWSDLVNVLSQHFESFTSPVYTGFVHKSSAGAAYTLHLSGACVVDARPTQFSLDDLWRSSLGNHTDFYCCAACAISVNEANCFTGSVYTLLNRVYYLFESSEASSEHTLQALSSLDTFASSAFALAEFAPDVVAAVKDSVHRLFEELFTLFVSANQDAQQNCFALEEANFVQALVHVPLMWEDEEDTDDADYDERIDAYKNFEQLMHFTTRSYLGFWEVIAPAKVLNAFQSEEIVRSTPRDWDRSLLEATSAFIKDGLSVKEAFATARAL